MDIMNANEIRQKFLQFFKDRGHAVIPSASLVPENDSTTLFTGSGMQPMVPYLLGEKHPSGNRIVDSQKSFRTVDIEEVGDNRHTTFFEMLGNWSLGDYYKKEQISWMFQFLTEELKLDPNRLYITVFIGDEKNNIPKDIESAELWRQLFSVKNIDAKEIEIGSEQNGYKIGMQNGRIFYYDAKKNWWSRSGVPENMPGGEPGGPDSEMFYDFGTPHDQKFGENCHPNCDCGRFIEIGNNVFMEYKKNSDGTFSKLPQQNVDFGGGLERLAMAVNNQPDIFGANHRTILNFIETASEKTYGTSYEEIKAFRIIADHMKASTFLIADGIFPSNTDRGYFVRRLIRRSVRYADSLGIKESVLSGIVGVIAEEYKESYSEVLKNKDKIENIIKDEEKKFRETLTKGLKEFKKGVSPFILFTTYGFPLEMTMELAAEQGIKIDEKGFNEEFKKHQELSHTASAGMFKGGLADGGEETKKLHTATHLLRQALEDVLKEKIEQKGSNITAERLRFDFTFSRKLTEDEKTEVEGTVNSKIRENLKVNKIILTKEEAEKTGAVHAFGDKYGDEVSVYYVGDSLESAYSKEFCGGPHVEKTGELGHFKIIKEEAVSAGVRRIKAILK
ncbi:MAG: alanine--tRNA ligase [Candidatus Paceibacterota bacterium]|jgi:alanyl-tRNA synthetase